MKEHQICRGRVTSIYKTKEDNGYIVTGVKEKGQEYMRRNPQAHGNNGTYYI
jgi:hypothetical protein